MTRAGFERRWRVAKAPTVPVNTDWTLKAPGGTWWRVMSIVARLVTDANVANRIITLRADDQTNVWYAQEAPLVVAANSTVDVSAHTGSGNTTATATTLVLALPSDGLLLPPGHRLFVTTANRQAGDQWTNVVAQIDEIPSDDPYVSTEGKPEPIDLGA